MRINEFVKLFDETSKTSHTCSRGGRCMGEGVLAGEDAPAERGNLSEDARGVTMYRAEGHVRYTSAVSRLYVAMWRTQPSQWYTNGHDTANLAAGSVTPPSGRLCTACSSAPAPPNSA